MSVKTCRYCLADVETETRVHNPMCALCQRKRQSQAVKVWYEKAGKRRERTVTVVSKILETRYYPWKFDPSVVLVVES